MKPSWDTLAEEFRDSKTVVIAEVDCTADGEPLCSRFKVEGFPTLKSFSPWDTEGEDYEGERELEELRAHAKSLGPGCSPSTKDECSTEDLAELEALMKLPAGELQAEITQLKSTVSVASEDHAALVKRLNAQFAKSEQKLKEVERTSAARLRLLRAAYGGEPPCEDDPSFKDGDGDGCAAYGKKPAHQCGHVGYEEVCTRCCATCSSTPKCIRLAAKAPELLKEEI